MIWWSSRTGARPAVAMRLRTRASASAVCVRTTVTPAGVSASPTGTAPSTRVTAGAGPGVDGAAVSGAGRNRGRSNATTPATAVTAVATAVTAMSARCQTVFWSSSRCARDGRLGAGRKAMSEGPRGPARGGRDSRETVGIRDAGGGPMDDLESQALVATRRSLHGVAELVIAGPQFRTLGSIELRVRPGGFGGHLSPVRVAGS